MKKIFGGILLLAVVIALYVFRVPLLQIFPALLIESDPLTKADAIIVLSGASYDRSQAAAELFHQGWAAKIICTGGNKAFEFRLLGLEVTEAQAVAMFLKQKGVPDSNIVVISSGTSTQEESRIISDYCSRFQLKRIILLTSMYHTRRAKKVFTRALKNSGTSLVVYGVPSSRFNEWYWWRSEDGLIAMNNELIKSIYYLFK